MSVVIVNDVTVLNHESAPFTAPFQFEITFECTEELEDDIEWKVIYVGSAESDQHDQQLESILVGPVPVGTMKFLLEAPAPDVSKIPKGEIRGVTVALVTCSYKEKEFVRIGYYVNNDYRAPELVEAPPVPDPPVQDMVPQLHRQILADKPRVTRYQIGWDNAQPDPHHADLMAGEENVDVADDDIMAEDDYAQHTYDGAEAEEDSEDGMRMEAMDAPAHAMDVAAGGMMVASN